MNNAITFNIPQNFYSDTNTRLPGILRAIRSWDGATVPGTSFTTNPLFYSRDNLSAPLVQGDQRNSITDAFTVDPSRRAVTYKVGTDPQFPGPYVWSEMDIVVNSSFSLADDAATADKTPSATGPSTSNQNLYQSYNFEGIVRHEIGHAVGFIEHEAAQVAVLTEYYSYGQARDIWMHGDDRNGLRTYYPPSGPPPVGGWETDLQILGWKLNGSGGAGNGDKLDPCSAPTPASVPAGGQIGVEFTIENLGTQDVAGVNLGFYLSTDAAITQQDLLIDSQNVPTPPAAVGGILTIPWRTGSPPLPVQIPCSVTPGSYYLGVILDYDHAIAESREDNNTLILPYEGAPALITVTAALPSCSGGGGPGQVRNVNASDNSCFVQVTWDPPASGGQFQRYLVQRRWWDPFEHSRHFRVYPPATSFVDHVVDTYGYEGAFEYTVFAETSEGTTGSSSNVDYGTQLPTNVATPGNPTASTNRCGQILLNWSWSPGDPDSFIIEGVVLGGRYIVPGYQRSLLITGLNPRTYTYSIRAAKACWSEPSVVTGQSRGPAPATFRIVSNVPDAQVIENGQRVSIPPAGYTVACTTCTASAVRTLASDPIQVILGARYCFDRWSDGGHRYHTVTLGSDSTITLYLTAGPGPTTVPANAILYDDAYDCKSPYIFQGSANLSTSATSDTFRVWGNVKFRFPKFPPTQYALYVNRPLIAKGARFETVDSTAVSGSYLWQGILVSPAGSLFLDSCTVRNAKAGIAHTTPCSPIANATIERCTFTNNQYDVDLWFDHMRTPSVRLVANKFHAPKALRIGVGGASVGPVGTATVLNNFFSASAGPDAIFELGGGWQGEMSGNTFTISQNGAQGLWLRRFDGGCGIPAGSYASPSVTISNNLFNTIGAVALQAPKQTSLVTQINATYNNWSFNTSSQIQSVILDSSDDPSLAVVAFTPWTAPPGGGGGGGGCPFVLTESEDGFRVENSILGRSEAAGQFVADAYPLSATLPGSSGRIRLRVAELETDTDEIDELRLASVSVPEGYKIATDSSGRPVLMRPVDATVRPRAWSGKQVPFISPIAPGEAYRGEPGDSLEFEVEPGDGTLVSNQKIGIQMIPKPIEPAAPMPEGQIGITLRVSPDAQGDRWFTLDRVLPREFWSTDVLSWGDAGEGSVRRLRVIWHTRHTLGWIGLVEATEATTRALACLSAKDSKGQSVLAELGTRDGRNVTLEPGEHVELEFDASGAPAGSQYVLLAYGRYHRQGSQVTSAAPAAHFLAQNRPNPFNPETSIEFGRPQASPVTLRVYSVAGRLVRTLVDRALPEGFHTARWNSRDDRGLPVASGVYFYELRSGSYFNRRRMVLLR